MEQVVECVPNFSEGRNKEVNIYLVAYMLRQAWKLTVFGINK